MSKSVTANISFLYLNLRPEASRLAILQYTHNTLLERKPEIQENNRDWTAAHTPLHGKE